MAVAIDDLVTIIDAATTLFTKGANLHKGRLPTSPSTVVTLIEVLGFEPPAETFGSRINIERPQIQVVSRAGAHDYSLARTNAEVVYQILRELSTSISNIKYHNIAVRSSPHFLGEDDNSRYLISFTLDVWKQPSS